jgi:hypothetical protein
MYGIEGIVERLVEVMNGVWRGEGLPENWREGVICPTYKKGEENKVENYRGITLLNTGYKMYALILSERTKREIEENDSQAGFRKGRDTLDNVYILDHLTKNELKKNGGRMYALFVDFRAAFDKVDTENVSVYMRKRKRERGGEGGSVREGGRESERERERERNKQMVGMED